MCGIEIRHCQIYKAAKILPLTHIFSGSSWRMCFTKMGGLRGHGIQKKKGILQKSIPKKIIRKSAKVGARRQRAPTKDSIDRIPAWFQYIERFTPLSGNLGNEC